MGERTMVVVADGGGVRVFMEVRRGGDLTEKTQDLELPRLHASGSPGPGRVFDRFGQASHGVTHEAPKEKSEREFLEELAKELPKIGVACTADKLVIMAPPRALGILREALPAQAQKILTATEPKDRRHATAEELRVALRELRREAV